MSHINISTCRRYKVSQMEASQDFPVVLCHEAVDFNEECI